MCSSSAGLLRSRQKRRQINKIEQKYLDIVVDKYNLCLTAGFTLGRRHTAESKLKIGAASQGRKFSEDTLLKFRSRKHSASPLLAFRSV